MPTQARSIKNEPAQATLAYSPPGGVVVYDLAAGEVPSKVTDRIALRRVLHEVLGAIARADAAATSGPPPEDCPLSRGSHN